MLAASANLSIERLAAQGNNGNPPAEQDINLTLDPGVACAFGVNLSGHGKGKTITLPGNRLIITSPGLHVTVTNLSDMSKHVTLNATGSSHITNEADGGSIVAYTGRNVNLDPVAGFVLAIGHFSIAFDADGNPTRPLQGKGKLIDICELIQ
jgi:hypothetical protein